MRMQDLTHAKKQIACPGPGPGVSGAHGDDTIRIQATPPKAAADVMTPSGSFFFALVREDVCALTTRVWRRVPPASFYRH